MNFLTFAMLIFVVAVAIAPATAQDLNVWFGTAKNNAGKTPGIYRSTFDTQTGNISAADLALQLDGAGWITWHPTLPIIYSTAMVEGKPSICAIRVADDQSLDVAQTRAISSRSCFMTTDRKGRVLVSTQYGGGTVISIPIDDDGMLGENIQEIAHSGGSNVVPKVQSKPHPHCACVTPNNRFVFVTDLGMDRLVRYEIDQANQLLVAAGDPVQAIAGGGPRHMRFNESSELSESATGKFALVLNELSMSVTCFEHDGEGEMKQLATAATLTEEEQATVDLNSASEIRIHPGGNFIYTGNRGHDSISVFNFSPDDGELNRVQVAPIHGAWPRNFNLSPDGKWLIVAGKNTNSANVFSINPDSGKLIFERKTTFVPGAICVSIRE